MASDDATYSVAVESRLKRSRPEAVALPADVDEGVELWRIARDLQTHLKPRTRWHKYRLRRNVFFACDAVDFLVTERYASSRQQATELGKKLQEAQLIEHSCRTDKPFSDSESAFRFREPTLARQSSLLAQTFQDDDESSCDEASGAEEVKGEDADDDDLSRMVTAVKDEARRLRHEVRSLRAARMQAECQTGAWKLVCAVVVAGFVFQLVGWKYGSAAISLVGVAAYNYANVETSMQMANEMCPSVADSGVCEDFGSPLVLPSAPGRLRRQPSVIRERVRRLRGGLEREHPDLDSRVFTDDYLKNVLAQPDKKNATQPRSVGYALEKLKNAVRFQKQQQVRPPEELTEYLKTGSLYWYGYDTHGRPVLWVRPSKKDYSKFSLDAELQMHNLMIDYGIRNLLHDKVTTFCICADTGAMGLTQVRPSLMRGILNIVTKAHPDRLGALYAGPVNPALKTVHAMMSSVMPANLRRKINLCSDAREDLKGLLLPPEGDITPGNEYAAIPDFLGKLPGRIELGWDHVKLLGLLWCGVVWC
uniref:CRAL-TRIO domain-containing protein n=1 Tax=Pinguiococcus pyrenoidosus TaxID=172671 RepID=A0A7R9U7G1_9STRA